MNAIDALENANKAILITAIPVFAWAGYEMIQFKIISRRLERKLKAGREMTKDPFALFSPEAKRVLYGK